MSTDSSYAKPVPSGNHFINLQNLTQGDCSTHTHTHTKYKKKVIITITRCSGNDVVPSPTPGWFVGRQCNLTRIPAAMRHLLYIHTGIRPGRYEIPQSGVNRYRAQGPATAPCSLTSRHNRINLHSLPPSFFFFFCFSLLI